METSEILTLKEKISTKIHLGDFITLGKVLGVAQNTARMRFHRSNKDAVKVMSKIITNRENLITELKSELTEQVD